MSNETKIGLLTVVAIALSFWGYKFIRGKNVLTRTNLYYVAYEDIDKLGLSTPVLINGFQIGFVADIKLNETHDKVILTLDTRKDIQIPKNTVARIMPDGFMGGKVVDLLYDTPCSGADCAQSGDYLKGEFGSLISSYLGEEEMKGYVNTLKEGLKEVIAELNNELSKEDAEGLGKSLQDLQATIDNLKQVTGQVNSLLYKSSGNIAGTLDNLESITGNLESSNSKINSILSNADTFSTQLGQVDVAKTMEEVTATVTNLKKTLETATSALDEVNGMVGKIQQGEGTLGKLMQDEELYNQLSILSGRTDSLLNDLQVRPYRYVPFKSRKKVKKFDRLDKKEASTIMETDGAIGSNQ